MGIEEDRRLQRSFRAVVLLPGSDGEVDVDVLARLVDRGVIVVEPALSGGDGSRPPGRMVPGRAVRADLATPAARSEVFRRLGKAGIHPADTVAVGEAPDVPEGVVRVESRRGASLLAEQAARRERMRVPDLTPHPSWSLVLDGTALVPSVRETLCALANGQIGVRGTAEEEPPGSDPAVFAQGVYNDDDPPGLLVGPRWTRLELDLPPDGEDVWTLDMSSGVLTRRVGVAGGSIRTLRFVSLARPGCAVLRAEAPRPWPQVDPLVEGPPGSTAGGAAVAAVSSRGAIRVAGRSHTTAGDGSFTLERLAAYRPQPGPGPDGGDPARDLAALERVGSDRLLAEHALAWSRRWEDAEVSIEGDPEAELALRFALFHLLSCAPTEGEAAVGARGLTGRAYRGHVFWETDVYVLPVLAATLPAAARAILEYRIRRLPAARRIAAEEGRAGARFPWESADEGTDVTPRVWTGPAGEAVPIHTATQEIHVVADVAWAARHYAHWAGDDAFLAGPGRDLIIEPARYWAGRVEWDGTEMAHLREVMGPDEYHPGVDDNAFTNGMARANLRWAAALAERHGGASPEEVGEWRRLARALVDGFDPVTGLYEQFSGYFARDPVDVLDLAEPPVAAELLLGPEEVARTQILKQADVLMLYHMAPEETAPRSLERNLDRYLRHTAHGSSLSPPIHASLLARAGRTEEALRWFRVTAGLDLEDLTGTAAGGVHLGAMAGLWQALVFGFLGTRLEGEVLRFDPHLPRRWERVGVRLVVRDAHLGVSVTPDEVEVESDRPVRVACGEGPALPARTGRRFRRQAGGWKET